jgi:membrane protease YdiL (CAAX protease family)
MDGRKWRLLGVYWILACAISWSWWIPLALSGDVTRAGQAWPTHLPGLLGPAIAAIIVTAVARGRAGLLELLSSIARWRVSWRWYALIAATAAVAALAIPAAVASDADVPSAADFARYSGVGAWPLIAVVAFVALVNGWGEETGWRGLMSHTLLPRYGVARTGLIVALPWALWHLPLFWVVESFREMSAALVVGWLVGLTSGSIVLTWIYAHAHHSILVVALWHTAYNFTSATDAAEGLPAALSSTLVMTAAVVIVISESVAGRRRHS